ncbi:hypothetical protein DIE19_34750 [Burkholderia sp. Bp9126]|nr:hypothetical protein DIE19_34750 [Burkholderia sp. Bp9126]
MRSRRFIRARDTPAWLATPRTSKLATRSICRFPAGRRWQRAFAVAGNDQCAIDKLTALQAYVCAIRAEAPDCC